MFICSEDILGTGELIVTAYLANTYNPTFLGRLSVTQLRSRLFFLKYGIHDDGFTVDFQDRLEAAKSLHRTICQDLTPSDASNEQVETNYGKMLGILWMAIVVSNAMISHPVYHEIFTGMMNSLILSTLQLENEFDSSN